MSEQEPYSEWYWTWVEHRWLRPVAALFDFMAHDPIGRFFTIAIGFYVMLFAIS